MVSVSVCAIVFFMKKRLKVSYDYDDDDDDDDDDESSCSLWMMDGDHARGDKMWGAIRFATRIMINFEILRTIHGNPIGWAY
jgi:hypothetical protein